MDVKLTRNQKIFCDEYLIDLNGSRAYKVAYKSVKKDETARANASRLLTNDNIKAYIGYKMKKREQRTEITQDKVLKELAKIGFSNVADYVRVVEKEYEEDVIDDEGNVIDKQVKKYKAVDMELTDDLTEEQQKVISEIKQTRNGIEVKLNDKVKALELIGRHLGMFNDKLELSGNVDVSKRAKEIDEYLSDKNER